MTFRDAPIGSTVIFGGVRWTVREQVPSHVRGGSLTVCERPNPKSEHKTEENTFNADLPCEHENPNDGRHPESAQLATDVGTDHRHLVGPETLHGVQAPRQTQP